MPKRKMFTQEETQQLTVLIYGSNSGQQISQDDIEAHFTLYMAAKDIRIVGQQKMPLLKNDLDRIKAQYIKDMQDHSPFTVKGGLMTWQKTVDKETARRKQWHSDLIKDAARNTYNYATQRAWFMGNADKKKVKDMKHLQSKMFGEDEQTVYAQSLYLKNKLPDYVKQDPSYAVPEENDAKLDHAKKFFHMIELFYRPISVLADPQPDPNPEPGVNTKMNHYCLAKLYFDEIIKIIGTHTTKDIIERDTIHTDKKKLGYLEKLNSELEMRPILAPKGISTLTRDECTAVINEGLDALADKNFELYKKALSGLKSAVPSLNIEEKLEKVEKEQISSNFHVKSFNDVQQRAVSRLQNRALLAFNVDAEQAATLRCNLDDEYDSSIGDVVKSLDVNSRRTQEARDYAQKDIETGAALFNKYTKDIQAYEEPYLRHDEIKKMLGDAPDHMKQYKVRIPSQGIKEHTDLRSAYNKIAEKNGCAKLTYTPEDDKKLKAFTFLLLLRDGVSLTFTPLVMKEHMVPALGEPIEVATDGKILEDIQREARRLRMKAEDERWNAKAAQDTEQMQNKLSAQQHISDENEAAMQDAENAARTKEHNDLKEELAALLPALALKKKTLGGYRNQSLQPLKAMVASMAEKLENNTLTDEERIDELIKIRNEAEKLKDRKQEAAAVLETVQSHLGNSFNLKTITRLEEAADRAEMEAQIRGLEYFEKRNNEAEDQQLPENGNAKREKMRQILEQPYVKEADAVTVQAKQKLGTIGRGYYTSEKEFEKNKAILTEAVSEIIAASLLKRIGMQTMLYEKGMNDGRADSIKLSPQEISDVQTRRDKENQSEGRQHQLANMQPEEKEREIRMAEIRSYADEIRTRTDFGQMMSTVTDWDSLEALKGKAAAGTLIDELAKHAKLVTAEEKKHGIKTAPARKQAASAEKAEQ